MLKLVSAEAGYSGRKNGTQEDLIRTKWLVSSSELWQLVSWWLSVPSVQCGIGQHYHPPLVYRQTYCPLSDGFHVASVIRTVEIFHWVSAGGSGRWYFLKQVCLLAICDHNINMWIQSHYLQDLEQFVFKYTLVLSVLSKHIPLILPHPEGQKKLFFPLFTSVCASIWVSTFAQMNIFFPLIRWHSTV